MDPATIVSIHPYFKVDEGKLDEFKALLPEFVERTSTEESCLYYDFTIQGQVVFCREAYVGAEAALHHLENVGELLNRALQISELIRLEFHGSADELAKLRDPLEDLNPEWFEFENGLAR